MVKWLMRRGTAAFERKWHYDASYVHEMSEASPRAAWVFSRASLAFAMVASRIYPTVKYAMGHGEACTRIVVGGTPVALGSAAVSASR